jgi:hypothetical protein
MENDPPAADYVRSGFMSVYLRVGDGTQVRVDDDVAEAVRGVPLHRHSDGYVWFSRRGRVYLHRFVMHAGKGDIVDHISGDKLDCQRANLRFCTRSENQANRSGTHGASGWRGVILRERAQRRPWEGYARRDHRQYRAAFYSQHVAALLSDAALRQFWAVPGYLNFPLSVPDDEVKGLLEASMGARMTIVFSRKRDGRLRRMDCRIPGLDTPAPSRWKAPHSDLIFVWEESVGLKAVPLGRILCVQIGKLRYMVSRPRECSCGPRVERASLSKAT